VNSIEVFRGDNGAPVINATQAEPWEISQALGLPGPGSDDPVMQKLQATMGTWARATKPSRMGGIFDRDRYVDPDDTFDQIRLARRALRDDVIGGAADLTESLALSATSIYSPDDDEQDVWNQWAAEFDMDSRLREAWRILYTDSQFVAATTWAHRTYHVRGKTASGNARRRAFNILVPTGLTYLDSRKVVPVGTLMFQREHLAYIADPHEAKAFDEILARRDGAVVTPPPGQSGGFGIGRYAPRNAGAAPSLVPEDDIVEKLIVGRYTPSPSELAELNGEGITSPDLYLLDHRYCFRHTLTRPTYQRFADVRLASCFELLDAKNLLRSMDRAHLIGGSNFIVLIKKGTDNIPAQQPEIDALRESVNTIAQVPVIVGDHRLSIDIITPKLDVTLTTSRYDLIDRRLTARALGTFVPTGADQGDPLKLGKVIGRNLESRRRMLRRSFEQHLFQPIRDSNDEITERAKLAFHPATIALSFDSAFASFLLDLREAKELSRDTILSQFDLDQRDEARQREREADLYDDTFGTIVPHGANPDQPRAPRDGDGGNDPDGDRPPPGSTRLQRRSGGRQGGRRNGGGAAPGSGQGQDPVSPRRLSSSREAIEDDLTGLSRDELIHIAAECPIPYRHQLRRDTLRESIRAWRDHHELHPEGDDQ
jgi:hypothetical protein